MSQLNVKEAVALLTVSGETKIEGVGCKLYLHLRRHNEDFLNSNWRVCYAIPEDSNNFYTVNKNGCIVLVSLDWRYDDEAKGDTI